MLRGLVLLAVFGAAAFAGWIALYARTPAAYPRLPLEFTIAPGSGLRSAIAQMQEQGALNGALQFEVMTRALGEATRIQAGTYEVSTALTPRQLLTKLTTGDQAVARIRFIEGWTFAQARAALDAAPHLKHDSRDATEAEIAQRLKVADGASMEGWLFPDTYQYAYGSSDWAVLEQASRAMHLKLDELWKARDATLPLASPYEALTLASIVEKETGVASDRPHIASVFINRLKRGMPLQTDPSVIYGIAGFDGNLRKIDLQTDGPYNTYMRPGLPPTPIALPGADSLEAALNPEPGDDLYFVGRGDGSSQFSSNLNDHEKAVDRYQRHPDSAAGLRSLREHHMAP